MKSFPLISIVILNYNGLKYLKRTIPAIMSLKYQNYEVIVVDNGSEDGSIEYIKKINRIRFIKSPRLKEKNFACNYAIKRANGKYILLLDNDLIVMNEYILDSLLDFYKRCRNAGAVTVAYYNEHSKRTRAYGGYFCSYFIRENKLIKLKEVRNMHGIKVGTVHGCNFFFEKDIWTSVGGYDDYLAFGGDDDDIGMRLYLLGYNVYLYAKTLNMHIGMPERSDDKKYAEKFKKAFYAQLYTIFKNYKLKNMPFALFMFMIFEFLKSIKQSIQRRNLLTFFAFFKGLLIFIKNISMAFKKRKEIQAKRVVKDDIFLKIRPAKVEDYD